jgi:hypothetical protein
MKFIGLLSILFVAGFLIPVDSQTITVSMSFYNSANCATPLSTQTSSLNNCIDTSSGGSSSSMKFTVCNSTLVYADLYSTSNCASGSTMGSLTKTPNSCDSIGPMYEKYSCSSSPSPGPSPGPVSPTNSTTVKSNGNALQWSLGMVLLIMFQHFFN